MMYLWQRPDWPNFRVNTRSLEAELIAYERTAGRLLGGIQALPGAAQEEALVDVLTDEAMHTSEIEGELLRRGDVASSIQRNLGLVDSAPVGDRRARGVAEALVVLRASYLEDLDAATMHQWHSVLMAHDPNVTLGCWRSHPEPMQIVSGPLGRRRVHFEAPPSAEIPREMQRFIDWFNRTGPNGRDWIPSAPVRAALVHLYFETLHPYEDGNGRIGRMLAEKALVQTTGFAQPLSLSSSLECHRSEYYRQLELAQRSPSRLEWVRYFVEVVRSAQLRGHDTLDFTVKKLRFYSTFGHLFNSAHEKVIARMFAAGPEGFKGGMSAAKYVSLARVSKATATRHLQELAEMGALIRTGHGRSTRYLLHLGQESPWPG
ncbi:MAG: hypothetical protein RLZZ261_792 [Bacteroidota bacterium]|jgi:Fic family protein